MCQRTVHQNACQDSRKNVLKTVGVKYRGVQLEVVVRGPTHEATILLSGFYKTEAVLCGDLTPLCMEPAFGAGTLPPLHGGENKRVAEAASGYTSKE